MEVVRCIYLAHAVSAGIAAYLQHKRIAGTGIHDLQSDQIMHVLLLPSEEFVPDYAPLAGIFQYHQAGILKAAGYKVGVISVRQSFSIPMIARSLLYKIFKKKVHNITDKMSFAQVLNTGFKKLFRPAAFLEKENKNGIRVYKIDGFYYLPPSDANNCWGWVKAGLTAYREYVKENGVPDLVHAHTALYGGMLARRIAKKYGVPYIITEHSSVFAVNGIQDGGLLKQVAHAYRESKGVFAVSRPFGDLLQNRFPGISVGYLPNVIDPELEEKQVVFEKIRPPGDFVFLSIGELKPIKNHRLLIDGFKRLKEKHPESSLKLWIAGDGPLQNELADYIAQTGLQADISLLGRLDRAGVFEALTNCDCFVLTSKFETFGVVLIEAMLTGKPVVTTRCGGPASFVTEETGMVVENDNAEALANAMERMMQRKAAYNAGNIRKYVMAEFGREKFIQRIHSIYHPLIKA
jgi:glycosyltransferase involved in cell wall biosynthesis